MKKNPPDQYIVEREFLSKLSAEDLLVRIIAFHIHEKEQKKGKGEK